MYNTPSINIKRFDTILTKFYETVEERCKVNPREMTQVKQYHIDTVLAVVHKQSIPMKLAG